ncbi:MAG TPA: KUP/HAK/KT family potassium transporter [Cytophagaceae bacterium]|jgi:KUP system potassium uptake protein|nr:KUP/HAK/KT family potassium transporter [Cytophagaceae bacterium]
MQNPQIDIKTFHKTVTMSGMLISIGIAFGDIGTSPLYTIKGIFSANAISEDLALGVLSCIFWTLFLQTTIKYIIITLRADNNGEGGILSLYALIRKHFGKWAVIPAIAGAAFLLADGLITPPISVASAIEGLQKYDATMDPVPIVIGILIALFVVQQFGTEKLGRFFGPIMLLWFGFIAIIGFMALKENFGVLKGLSPHYAFNLLAKHPGGFWLLGGVFLCTTGAEALYSDMGHCGRNNIRMSWIFIKISLVICYAGQTAWLLKHQGEVLNDLNPFYEIVPGNLLLLSVIISTAATIIASQALISGSFSLVNEAMRLSLWPRHKIKFPADKKGQLYIPFINWLLMIGCIFMVLHFKESKYMEAAFGLSVSLTMLMSTILITCYLLMHRLNKALVVMVTCTFLIVETSFLIANLKKFEEGGWITLLLGLIIVGMMYIWMKGTNIKKSLIETEPIQEYVPALMELSKDTSISKFATNLVYMTPVSNSELIETKTIYSIFQKSPKRADNYWFVNVSVLDVPYALRYKVETIAKDDVYFIYIKLGFREAQRVNYYLRLIIDEMVKNKEVDISSRYSSLQKGNISGDFKFMINQSYLSLENNLSTWRNLIMKLYFLIKKVEIREEEGFGLETSNVILEKYPLIITPPIKVNLIREL